MALGILNTNVLRMLKYPKILMEWDKIFILHDNIWQTLTQVGQHIITDNTINKNNIWTLWPSTHLGIELGENFKVTLEVSGQDGFYHKESEPLELALLQMTQPVESRIRQKQAPCRGNMVALQNGAIIIQNGLQEHSKDTSTYQWNQHFSIGICNFRI